MKCLSCDGARVKKTYNGVTTYYVGALYEYTTWNGGSSTSKYYYFGAQRIAMKQDINISYIHGDHLGSTNKTTGASGSTQTYYPYGAIKTSSGTPATDYGFTGQKRDATANLMYYGARYYDPTLARFIQADTIVPNPMDPQSLNRYSYGLNNPVKYEDPSGHVPTCEDDPTCGDGNPNTGAGTGGEDDPNVQSPTEPPYCEQYPEQCMTLSAGDGGNQGGDGDCSQSKCKDEPTVAPILYLDDPNVFTPEALANFFYFHSGYSPMGDPNWRRFSDIDQAGLVWLHAMWSLQVKQDAGISGNLGDLWNLGIGGAPLAVAGMARFSRQQTLPGGVSLFGEVDTGAKTFTVKGENAYDVFNQMTANGSRARLPARYKNGIDAYEVEGGIIGLRMSDHGPTIDIMNYQGYPFDRIHFR